jgi:hypothetical protein
MGVTLVPQVKTKLPVKVNIISTGTDGQKLSKEEKRKLIQATPAL